MSGAIILTTQLLPGECFELIGDSDDCFEDPVRCAHHTRAAAFSVLRPYCWCACICVRACVRACETVRHCGVDRAHRAHSTATCIVLVFRWFYAMNSSLLRQTKEQLGSRTSERVVSSHRVPGLAV